jgi:hypothetical protein
MKVYKLPSNIGMFYDISGAPGIDVKPLFSDVTKKIFVQSTSQGSRCLKNGMKLLYKVGIILLLCINIGKKLSQGDTEAMNYPY